MVMTPPYQAPSLVVAYNYLVAETAAEFAWVQYRKQIILVRFLQTMLLRSEISSEHFCLMVYACMISARQWYETARDCDRSASHRTEEFLGSVSRRIYLGSQFSQS